MDNKSTIGLAIAAVAAIVGCGGGGGSQPSPPLVSSDALSATSNAQFSLTIPSATTASSAIRRTAYVSSNAQSIAIATTIGAAAPGAATIANLTVEYDLQTQTDYYVPGGIGLVCETLAKTQTSYRFSTGIISSQTVTSYAYGLTNVPSLGLHRSY